MNYVWFSILIILFVTFTAFPQTTWKVDKVHSGVKFSVSHMVVADVEGAFTDFDVTVTTTKSDFSDMSVQATINTASINTENERRDTHLRADDFFNAEKYPTMTFTSTKVEKTGPNMYNITGDLTIRDVTKPVVLATTFKGTMTDPMGIRRSGFRATTQIKRAEFNVRWSKALDQGGFVVGDEVMVTLLMEMTNQN